MLRAVVPGCGASAARPPQNGLPDRRAQRPDPEHRLFHGLPAAVLYNLDQIQNLITTFGVSNPVALAASMVGLQGLIETAVCGAVATAVTVPLRKILKTR